MESLMLNRQEIINQLQFVPDNKLKEIGTFIKFLIYQTKVDKSLTNEKTPNKITLKAMEEIEKGEVIRAKNPKELLQLLKD